MTDINGKRALVTGAAGGIGSLLAKKLASAGDDLGLQLGERRRVDVPEHYARAGAGQFFRQ